jgi:hypothetical protein
MPRLSTFETEFGDALRLLPQVKKSLCYKAAVCWAVQDFRSAEGNNI